MHVSTSLLPITQLKLKAHHLLTSPTPQVGLVALLRRRGGREDGRADKLTLDRRVVPAVLEDEAIIIRIVSRWVGDEPDVCLGARAAGERALLLGDGQFGNVDLQHAARGSRGNVAE